MTHVVRTFATSALALALFVSIAGAQKPAESGDAKPIAATHRAPTTIQTIFLANAVEQNDLNDIQTALRNTLPEARIYGSASQDAITLRATAEEIEAARQLVAALDRPRKLYRLTYTIADFEGNKRTGERKFVLLAVAGKRTVFKQGSRLPVVTGAYAASKSDLSTQMQYVDVGLSIEATVSGSPEELRLFTKIEQSSPSEEKPAPGTQDPTFHQTALEESAELTPGKSLVLGSLDLPEATHRQQIEIAAELVR